MRSHLNNELLPELDWQRNSLKLFNKGLKLICYEGGEDGYGPIHKQISHDPAVYDLYMECLKKIMSKLDGVFVHYTHTGYDQNNIWGAKLSTDQSLADAHKYRAIYDYIRKELPQPPPEQSIVISLYAGWNLISSPLELKEKIIERAFSSIAGKYRAIYEYDVAKSAYKRYVSGQNNDFTTIEVGHGYWIYMNTDATLNLIGSISSKNIELKQGWNMVGYNSLSSRSVAEATSSINGKYSALYAFDTKANAYVNYTPGNQSKPVTMDPGTGFWILVTQPAVWSF
jgi:hypothetical protein